MMVINSSANAVILVNSTYDSSKFILGDIIDNGLYQEIIPKLTDSDIKKIASKDTLKSGFKIYNTTKKQLMQWVDLDNSWIIIEDSSAISLTSNTSTTSSKLDVSSTLPEAGYLLVATSQTTSEWVAATSSGADKNFIWPQTIPSSSWDITHNLNKYPSVIVLDSSGNTILPDITYVSNNRILLTFSSVFSGQAILN